MAKVKIKLVSIGHLPLEFQPKKIENWQSSTFEAVGKIDNFALRCDSDGYDWQFSDVLVKQQLPANTDADFIIAIVNVPIENNWYSRRLGNNQIVFTFHQISEILQTTTSLLKMSFIGCSMPIPFYIGAPETKSLILVQLLDLRMTKPGAVSST